MRRSLKAEGNVERYRHDHQREYRDFLRQARPGFRGESTESWDVGGVVPRFRLDYGQSEAGESLAGRIAASVKLPGAGETQAIVIGSWGFVDAASRETVEALVAYREVFPDLCAPFFDEFPQARSDQRLNSGICSGTVFSNAPPNRIPSHDDTRPRLAICARRTD